MSAAIIPRMNRATVLGVSVSLAIGLSACSGDSGSPTSPSASLSGGATTISGTALAEGGATSSSQRTSLSTRTFGALDNPDDLRVCVMGTDVCVGIGESGTFELNGDLEGDVELHITGRDQDVRVTVDDVRAGETVVVSIRLNGDHGSLEVESRRGGSSDHLVGVCHVTGNGDYQLLEIDESAMQAHIDHGDGIPGDPALTDTSLTFDDDCGTIGPAIDIEKSTNGEDADRGSGPRIARGTPVVWTYEVTNTGNVALMNVVVSDSREDGVMCPKDSLVVDEKMMCTLAGIATAGRYSNIGTVTAEAPEGVEVTDSDASHYVGTGEGEEEDEEENDEEEGEKVVLCHATGNGTYRPITVSMSAVPAHMAHGDGQPEGQVPNSDPEVSLDENCAVLEVAPE